MKHVAKWITASEEITPEWVLSLNIPKRKPQDVNPVDHKVILDLVDNAYQILNSRKTNLPSHLQNINKEEKDFSLQIFNSKVKQLRMTRDEIIDAYSNDKQTTIKKSVGTYIKFDSLSYDKFLYNIDVVENVLESLKGYHKDVAQGVKVKFVGSGDIKSKALYKTSQDTLFINSSKVKPSGNEYAGLEYVIVHELGHRYLKMHPQHWDYDSQEWATTKYSMVDSMTGEEKFAELFALSNWTSKYPQYVDKIKKFEEFLKK